MFLNLPQSFLNWLKYGFLVAQTPPRRLPLTWDFEIKRKKCFGYETPSPSLIPASAGNKQRCTPPRVEKIPSSEGVGNFRRKFPEKVEISGNIWKYVGKLEKSGNTWQQEVA